MSVINQMLKDLDKRTEPQASVNVHVEPPVKKTSTLVVIVMTVLVMLLLTGGVLYFWGLYQTGTSLKQNITHEHIDQKVILASEKNIEVTPVQIKAETPNLTLNKTQNKPSIVHQKVNQSQKSAPLPASVTNAAKQITDKELDEKSEETNKALASDVLSTNVELKNQNSFQQPNIESSNNKVNYQNQTPSSLSITRKKLSPKELASQKMANAERAIAENNLALAEKLFEDVLLIMPTHDIARQQLSALLFGRKAYQSAINILQQGIISSPNNDTFRLMKARIHLTVGQTEQAFDALIPLADILNSEYQSILASSAQQIKNFDAAIKSYSILTKLEPQQGRYWLGLAIAYDSNSQFNEAIKAYQQTIEQGGLSNAAFNFAQQRLAELGE